ncbi:CocE/NonD family hydrolase [Salininema proteolyticum]|uniref:Xaa-Pro dipeptidyl-peptidase n=1 Tax=Salininema proteolyticum TaxID=1607685 RepID=A0ABV8TXE3_9ACTN
MPNRRIRWSVAALTTGALVGAGVTGAGATAQEEADRETVRETVYVESDIDSDSDGSPDRIAVELVRPAGTEDGEKVPVIAQPSPYYGLSALQALRARGMELPIQAQGTPAHFGGWFDEYFVERGYAYLEPEMQGTARSDGCPTTGGTEDTASITAVVDWISGRAKAYDSDGAEVEADWAEPSVGMIGTSYNGTLPNAVAATGIEEVKTIVPTAAISSWYDYTSAEGIRYSGWDGGYPKYLAEFVASSKAKQVCGDVFEQLAHDAEDATADLNEFWDERDYRSDADKVEASVLHVHGQADYNVKTTHAGRWWEALAEEGVDQKLWLHPGAHSDPTGATPENRKFLEDWFDHWLKGEDNGVMDGPPVRVDRTDGSTDEYDSWPASEATEFHFGEDADGRGTLGEEKSPEASHPIEPGTVDGTEYIMGDALSEKDFRRTYATEPLTEERHLSGIAEVEVEFESGSDSTPVSAVLFSTDEDGSNPEFITRGAVDGKNHDSLREGEELVPGEKYSAEFELEPRDAVVGEGKRLVLAIVANYPDYVSEDAASDGLKIHLDGSKVKLSLD